MFGIAITLGKVVINKILRVPIVSFKFAIEKMHLIKCKRIYFQGENNIPNRRHTNNNAENKKRKCGLCRQEGHTKIKCPRKAQYEV